MTHHQSAAMKRSLSSAASQASVRQQNLSLLAKLIFSADSPPSRAALANQAGLGRATVSRLLNDLIRGGIVTELEPEDATSRGRPGTPVAPAQRTIAGLGLEANVHIIAGQAIDLSGTTLAEFRLSNLDSFGKPEQTLRLLGDTAAAMVTNLAATGVTFAGASLGLPGMINTRDSSLLIAPNLGWENFDPVALLGEKWNLLNIPTHAHNDADLQSIAATHSQPGKTSIAPDSFLYIAGDVGIGGALVLNGRPIRGGHGWAGEVGHITIEPNGPICGCGSHGCLEAYAGQLSIRSAAGLPADTPIDTLTALLEDGNPKAHSAIEKAGWALGIALSDIVNVLDLPLVIFGTQLGALLPWLRPHIEQGLDQRLLGFTHRTLTLISEPPMRMPGCIGGAHAALLPVIHDPCQWLTFHPMRSSFGLPNQ